MEMKFTAAILVCLATAACATTADPTRRGRFVTPAEAPAPSCEGQDSKTLAVVVGVNFYQDERISDLKGAASDAWAFYHLLASPDGGAIPESRLRLLLNEEATRNNVVGALGNHFAAACPQDQLIVYFAGHGETDPVKPDDAFLLVHDTSTENMVATGVSMARLYELLRERTKAQNLVMIIDACRSGHIRFPGRRGAKLGNRISAFEGHIEKAATGTEGWGVITATASDSFSLESEAGWDRCGFDPYEYAGGLFTCHLLAGLSGRADKNADGAVTATEVFGYLHSEVSKDSKGQQVPEQSGALNPELVLMQRGNKPVAIPALPERYRHEPAPAALTPLLWVGGGLTAAALTSGVVFLALQADTAGQIDAGERDLDRGDAEREWATLGLWRDTSFVTAGLFGAAVVSGLFWLLLDEPEGPEAVYDREPLFELDVAPIPQGAMLGLHWTWD